jgi:cytoskeletal protein CcmA (bactofilin family)
MSSPSVRPGVNEQATVGKSVVIKGEIVSREDLYLDGEVEGTVELPDNRLTIGPNARIKAHMKALAVVILGSVHGNIEARERIEIRKDATLVGDIKTARIILEDGAYFKGSVDIARQEGGKPAPAATKPQPQPPPQSQPKPPAAPK